MDDPENEKKPLRQASINLTAAGLAGQLGCVIPIIIIAAVLGGVWLDKTLSTDNHPFVILLLVASLPVSIFLTFKIAMRAVKDINEAIKPSTTPKKIQPEEDETGEQ